MARVGMRGCERMVLVPMCRTVAFVTRHSSFCDLLGEEPTSLLWKTGAIPECTPMCDVLSHGPRSEHGAVKILTLRPGMCYEGYSSQCQGSYRMLVLAFRHL